MEGSQIKEIRSFPSGATRDSEEGKLDYEGFLNPLVLRRFGEYMHLHRLQPDGKLRDSDNWQKGIPLDAYMKSGWRHFHDWWSCHRGYSIKEGWEGGLEEALCALLFNTQGYLLTLLKGRHYGEKGIHVYTTFTKPYEESAALPIKFPQGLT